MADVMGYSGDAFRITIDRETVNPAAPTVYSPYDLMGRTFILFGFKVEQVGIPTPATPEQLESFISFIQTSIDKGVPVTGWDLFIPEFGIIYGYDHEKQVLYARETLGSKLTLNIKLMYRGTPTILPSLPMQGSLRSSFLTVSVTNGADKQRWSSIWLLWQTKQLCTMGKLQMRLAG
ncbi:MAG: hypothetical protein J7639_31495 [Paenibacillaceae bacterium]|nr:hypothetical protein [Paenibacillaceae bacterium]